MNKMPNPLIEFKGIEKRFGENQVLKGIDLIIYEGVITAIIGKSGTGKSILMKHIVGLIQQDAGELLIEGRPFSQMNQVEKKLFRIQLSYMFQNNALCDFLNIFDNIALPLSEARGIRRDIIKAKVSRLMEQLSLVGIENQFPIELSEGMRKRVALARALITDPKIVLFDEPTTGLDPVRKQDVYNMIREYQSNLGFTAVIVTHDIPEIFDLAQRILMLDMGKIIFEGTKEEILNSQNEQVRNFVLGVKK